MRRWVAQLARFSFSILFFMLAYLFAATPTRSQCKDGIALPEGAVGMHYPVQLGAESGQAPFKWKLEKGPLPPGLKLSSSGMISGTPTYVGNQDFTSTFSVRVFESSKAKLSYVQCYSIVIKPSKFHATGAAPVASNVTGDPAAPTCPGTTPPATTQAPASVASPQQSTPATDANKVWEARSIVGYHQAGASSANFTQNFFFDFFIMRALSPKHLWEARTNLWGDIRVASFPQQVTTGAATVGTFVGNFGGQVSNVRVNQLAQSADFQSGLELRAHTWKLNTDDNGNGELGYRTVGVIGFAGALGAFQAPDAQMEIFDVPGTSSLQYKDFIKAYPTTVNAKYVGFVPPNRERFFRNYGIGVRFTTFDKGAPLAPPATYTVSFGQDESITYGKMTSVVGKIDVFYPLPLGTSTGAYKFIFLFATANLRLSKATDVPTFALQNPNATSATVQPFDPALAVITVPSTRDTYRFGAGVDLVNLIQSIATKGQVNTP
jgi:hypothetical protein